MALTMIESLMNDGFVDPATLSALPSSGMFAPAAATPPSPFESFYAAPSDYSSWQGVSFDEYGNPTMFADASGQQFTAAERNQLRGADIASDPWSKFLGVPLRELDTVPTRYGAAIDFANVLGIDPAQAVQWFEQGVNSNAGTDFYAGALDTNNRNLVPAWGMLEIARQSGALENPMVAEYLRQFADQGNAEKDVYNATESATGKAKLGQFIGGLGALAFAPYATGGLFEGLGSKLATGAASSLGSIVGGGNPLTSLAGTFLPIGVDASGLSGMLGDINPVLKTAAENVVGQFAQTGNVDLKSLGLASAGAGLDWGWNEIGKADGLFGDSVAPDIGIDVADAEPFMLKTSTSLTPVDYSAPLPDYESSVGPISLQMSDLPDVNGLARTFYLGEYATPSVPQPVPAEGEDAAPAPAEQPPISDSISGEETFVAEPQKEKTPFSSLKPSTILKLAVGLAGMLGGSDASNEARAVYEAEYANDEARRQAYLDYANRVFAAIPGIADAYDPKAYSEIGQFGKVEIDPKTGEARFVPNAEGQKSIDDLIGAADKVIDQILNTDTSKLSAEEFQKALVELQSKRDADFTKLMRVLYARGLLGLATYGEAFDNPFTGRVESYLLEDGQAANPYIASYLSGVERQNAELAGQSMNTAEDFIDNLLGQSTDLTGQLGARSGTMLDAILGARGRYGDITAAGQERGNALAQLLQSPAGMFGGDAAAALAAEGYMSEEERRRLLAMLGGE